MRRLRWAIYDVVAIVCSLTRHWGGCRLLNNAVIYRVVPR